ncbi:GNAT family N-acetyltransferase [Paenibacillus sp. J2TS4]|uniref:GNAT family N-acetyltransferase n=1 Tax=Paenibacillus sp. J2TS4 TaxID=2807194 RepID=UPI001B26E279|nr:GNAT family N-acetyltransferase [Paenibacillus sp. J2TS4]GIP32775.1 GNAT family N-acetyltransferase [Paenibacillus sp. J2TS4]
MSWEIRPYQPKDQEAVQRLHWAGLNQFNARLEGPDLDQDLENIEKIYINNNGDFIVGLMDNRVVCMGALRKFTETVAEIKRIRVDQEFQRKGLGQKILSALEKSAKEKGYRKLRLDTTSKQRPAQILFERNGYQVTVRKRWDDLEIIFYEKELE